MTNTSSIANRYITAVFATMQSGGSQGDLIADITSFSESINQDKLAAKVFFNRIVPIRIKQSIANNLFQSTELSDATKNLINTLIKNGRLHYLNEILKGLISKQNKADGFTEIRFETGTDLPVNDQDNINKELAEILSCKPKTTFIHNEKMLGGFKLFFDTKMIDKSFRSKLNRIKKMLKSTEVSLVDESKIKKNN